MADFEFVQNPLSKQWTVLAPRRAKRTNEGGQKPSVVCPFCIGNEAMDAELYRVGGKEGDSNWEIRVIPNKFPFTAHHELVIHSPDHHKNIDELAFSQVELIFQTYRQRFLANQKHGQVYIFHNRGHEAGESLPHPHTQISVVPFSVRLDIPLLDSGIYGQQFSLFGKTKERSDVLETDHFLIFCPPTSAWPDEVWIAPKRRDKDFGKIHASQITDLAMSASRIIQIFDIRNGYEFPFNFYIYPGKNWYLRFIPRIKILGGFELGTNIIVNTQEPAETFNFIREHFWTPDVEKIKKEHQAEYLRSV